MSYSRICDFEKKRWSRGSNSLPHLGGALPDELQPHIPFISARLIASKQDLLYQVMCLCQHFFFLFAIFPKSENRRHTPSVFSFLFSLFSFSVHRPHSCSPQRGRLSRCLIASCAGMPPYNGIHYFGDRHGHALLLKVIARLGRCVSPRPLHRSFCRTPAVAPLADQDTGTAVAECVEQQVTIGSPSPDRPANVS